MITDDKNLFWLVGPSKHAKDIAKYERLDDYLITARHDFLKGWTDCDKGACCLEYQHDAYYRCYSYCYTYEQGVTDG